ncbi:MAG: hypothetical protein VB099_06860 [Candidatus Limiplasma sp.]|nr:hypothetical protein [Candidatus Limiplasma sp.]
MRVKHRIRINVAQPDGSTSTVLHGGSLRIRERLLRFLLGHHLHVLVIAPGESVSTISIHPAHVNERA